jgi:cytochrome c553
MFRKATAAKGVDLLKIKNSRRLDLNKKFRVAIVFGSLIATGVPVAQSQTDESLDLWAPIPEWAYGYDSQPQPGDTPPIPTPGNRALQPGEDAEELARLLTLEGSSATFSRQEIRHAQDVIDWFPEDYPPMADIIKYGPEALRGGEPDWACGSCHLPNGKGRPSNAPVAGLPAEYMVQQLRDFRNGLRYSADPRKPNTPNMIRMARAMTEEEMQESAGFWAAVPWTRRYYVMEADLIPEMYLNPQNNMFFTVGTEPTEPLDGRIIETPVDTYQADYLRNPRMGFNVYVPVGSLAKGEELVTTGGAGKTIPCAICHGHDLMGLGLIPGIAGRAPSYVMRQLYDLKQGTRNGISAQLMQPTIANLTLDDMTNIAAYLASIIPPEPGPGGSQ